MEYRTLGQTGIKVSPVALGCMSLCGNITYGDIPESQAAATVQAAIDCGINFFDTAPMYGDGESERRLGRALAGRPRDRIIIADKINSPALSAAEVSSECENSLRLLQTDYIDLYQIHWPKRVVPLDETLDAMEALIAAGKVRAFGVCNFGPLELLEAASSRRCATDQLPYSLLWRGLEHEVRPICLERGIGILCYSPLAQGLLTGRYRHADEVPEARARTRLFSASRPQARHGQSGCESEMFAAIERIRSICRGIGQEMADVALAWLLHQPGVSAVLAGASRPEQVRSNVRAAGLKLPPEALAELDEATSEVKRLMGRNLDPWQAVSRIT